MKNNVLTGGQGTARFVLGTTRGYLYLGNGHATITEVLSNNVGRARSQLNQKY